MVAGGDDYFAVVTLPRRSCCLGESTRWRMHLDIARCGRQGSWRLLDDICALSLIARHLDLGAHIDRTIFAPLAPPAIAHFGHMFAGDARQSPGLPKKLASARCRGSVSSMLSGLWADIRSPKRRLSAGPNSMSSCPSKSRIYRPRFVPARRSGSIDTRPACRARPASPSPAAATFSVIRQYAYASTMAMGLASCGLAIFAAKWFRSHLDGAPSQGPAGTGQTCRLETPWRANPGDRAGASTAICSGLRRACAAPTKEAWQRSSSTDFAGFSHDRGERLAGLLGRGMREVATVLDAHHDQVICRNSWGDALYAVTGRRGCRPDRARITGRTFPNRFCVPRAGRGGGMRIGAHYGPVANHRSDSGAHHLIRE